MPTWIYIGSSSTQINNTSDPANNPTTLNEAQALVGRSYDSSAMQGVEVTGTPTSFGGANFGRGVDELTYTIKDDPDTPIDESKTATAVYTSHVVVDVAVTVGRYDADGNWEESQINLPGVIIQMENGDTFLRPYFSSVDEWDSALSNWGIVEVHVNSVATPTAPSTPANPNTTDAFSGGLNAGATFPPRLIGRPVDQPNPCFVAGTLIRTQKGLVPVETICRGDLVETKDDGLQPVRWIGSRTVHLGRLHLPEGATMAPIQIAAGALGEDLPVRELRLSPQHRVLVRSRIAQRMFGAPEVLVAAKQLLAIDGIDQLSDTREVTFVHIMFDKHQIVYAEGAEVESLFVGKEALKSISNRARDEVLSIFPELADPEDYSGAREFVDGKKARELAERHVANDKPLVELGLTD